MTRFRLLGAVFAAIVLTGMFLLTRANAGEKSENKIKAIATATKLDKDGKQKVTITIDVAKDWYIYANPVGNKFFEDNCTTVSIAAKEKLKVDLVYPAGKEKTEGKTTLKIYQPSVVIEANVQRSPGDVSPLQVSIEINACRLKDGKTAECLLPGTVKVTVP